MVARESLVEGTRIFVLPEGRIGEVVKVYDEPSGPHVLVRFDEKPYECHHPCCEDEEPLSDYVPLDRIELVPPPDRTGPLSGAGKR